MRLLGLLDCGSLTLRTPNRFHFADRPSAGCALFGLRLGRRATLDEPNDIRGEVVVVCCSVIELPSGNQLRGRRSTGIVLLLLFGDRRPPAINMPDSDQWPLCCGSLFVVPASNGWRRSTPRQTFEPECVNCVCDSRSMTERRSTRRTAIIGNCVLFRTLQEPIIRRRALHGPIELKQSRDTGSNGLNASPTRTTCG